MKKRRLRNRVKRFDSNNENSKPTLRDLLINIHKLDPGIVQMLAEL